MAIGSKSPRPYAASPRLSGSMTSAQYEARQLAGGRMPNLTAANVRVIIAKANTPDDRIPALINPRALALAVNLEIGKLHPVGSSHPTKQYAYTDEVTWPLELHLSSELFRRRGVPADKAGGPVQRCAEWLMSCAYASQRGAAPEPLLIVWPRVVTAVYAPTSISVNYVRFDANLRPVEATASLQGGELRRSFRSGWLASDSYDEAVWAAQADGPIGLGTGRPMNLVRK